MVDSCVDLDFGGDDEDGFVVNGFGNDGFYRKSLSLTASLIEDSLTSLAASLANGFDGFF